MSLATIHPDGTRPPAQVFIVWYGSEGGGDVRGGGVAGVGSRIGGVTRAGNWGLGRGTIGGGEGSRTAGPGATLPDKRRITFMLIV